MLHPFVALLSSDDSVTVEHRVIIPRRSSLGGLNHRKWATEAQTLLKELHSARRGSKAPLIEPPSRLTLPVLLHHLEEPSRMYKPTHLLAELGTRTASTEEPLTLQVQAGD